MRTFHRFSKDTLKKMAPARLLSHFYNARHQAWVTSLIDKSCPAKSHVCQRVSPSYVELIESVLKERAIIVA